jgi:hypothetical protein
VLATQGIANFSILVLRYSAHPHSGVLLLPSCPSP